MNIMKLVKESLNEIQNFKRRENPHKKLRVGEYEEKPKEYYVNACNNILEELGIQDDFLTYYEGDVLGTGGWSGNDGVSAIILTLPGDEEEGENQPGWLLDVDGSGWHTNINDIDGLKEILRGYTTENYPDEYELY